MKYQPTRDPVLKDPYDEWLARIACFAFSVAPTPFISQVNRATAESAQDAALAEGLAPLQIWVKRLIDTILAREFGVPDLEFAWALDREQDPAAQAGIDQIYVQSGVKSIDEVRATLGLAPIGYGNAVMGLQPYPVGPGTVGKTQAALKYSPDQPRVPAGNPTGGQWTSGDGADGSSSGGKDQQGTSSGVQLLAGTIPADAPKPGDTIVIKPNDPDAWKNFVPTDQLPPASQNTFGSRTLLPNGDMAVQIPGDRIVVPPKSGDGAVYQDPNADGEASSSRIMTDGTNQYPDGRVIFKNSQNQEIDPYTGSPGSAGDVHSHYQGIYNPPAGDDSDSSPPSSGGSSDTGTGSGSDSTTSSGQSSAPPSDQPRIIIPPIGGESEGGYGGNPGPVNPKIPRDELPGALE
jgi:hypothetical protein